MTPPDDRHGDPLRSGNLVRYSPWLVKPQLQAVDETTKNTKIATSGVAQPEANQLISEVGQTYPNPFPTSPPTSSQHRPRCAVPPPAHLILKVACRTPLCPRCLPGACMQCLHVCSNPGPGAPNCSLRRVFAPVSLAPTGCRSARKRREAGLP